MSVATMARAARTAARVLGSASSSKKNLALQQVAEALENNTSTILAANELDLVNARAIGSTGALIDRMLLTPERITDLANAVRQIATLSDPVGEVLRSSRTEAGLDIQQIRVPFGVIAIVYEARPNVTVDAAALGLKSGNAVLLRGSSSAHQTNAAIVSLMRGALADVGLPEDLIALVPSDDRASVDELLTARGLIDVVIPRGGAALIERVVAHATVPVIETGVGNCHIYIHKDADIGQAIPIVVNAKVSRPSVCNAVETVLIHRDLVSGHLSEILAALTNAGVCLHADAEVLKAADLSTGSVVPATDEDWSLEYGSLDVAISVVDSLEQALDHIARYSSGHTEAILTQSDSAAQAFIEGCDSAVVMVNASTRFTDGGEFGFGAEMGISTQKLHARGPMALPEMTTTKWVVRGSGQIRG